MAGYYDGLRIVETEHQSISCTRPTRRMRQPSSSGGRLITRRRGSTQQRRGRQRSRLEWCGSTMVSRAPSGTITLPGSAEGRQSFPSSELPGSLGTSRLTVMRAHSRRPGLWRPNSVPALQRASSHRPGHHHRRSMRFWRLWICISHRSRGSRERAQPAMAASAWRTSPRYSRRCRTASRRASMACHMSSTITFGTSSAQSSQPCSARPSSQAVQLPCQPT